MKNKLLGLGIVLIIVGVLLLSPILNNDNKLGVAGGTQPTVYWHFPYNDPTTPTQLVADVNHIPWIIVYTPDERNYTDGYTEIANYLGNAPWPINGTLQISGGAFSATAKLGLAAGQKMQVGYLYSFGLLSDWQTMTPWYEGDPIPVGSTVIPAWNDPTRKFLCTPGTLSNQLHEGVIYTFSWTINVPGSLPLTALGYGKKYYNIQGIWTLNGNPVAPVAVTMSSPSLGFNFKPTVGAENISTVYVQVLMRGALSPSIVTLTKTADAYVGSYSLGQEGVYDINCYFKDLQGTVYSSTSTVIVYSGVWWNPTPLRLSGFGLVGFGVVLVVWDRKRKK